MIAMSTAKEILRLKHHEGLGTKEIAKRLKISRNTVKAELRGERSEENRYERKAPYCSKLGPHKAALDALIEENEKLPKKRRRPAKRLYEDLVGQGYEGSYDQVHRHVKRWKEQRQLAVAEAFVPLVFAPGEATQFDFSDEVLEIAGLTTLGKAAHMTLCHSGLSLAQVFPAEKQEMMLEGMKRGFEFFGGVTRRIILDNLKAAVKKVLQSREREWTDNFLGFCRHYIVEPTACQPGKGNQKGQVERGVQTKRDGALAGIPKAGSFEEMNALLVSEAIAQAKRTPHRHMPQRTVWQVFVEDELPQLMELPPKPYGCCVSEEAKLVDKVCTVAFEANRYSVPCQFVRYRVQVRAHAFEVKIFHQGKLLATHPRLFGKGQTAYDPMHYLDLLKTKPQALNNGRPFVNWELPPVFTTARQVLLDKHRKKPWEGDKAFIQVLLLLQEYALEEVTTALELAVEQGSPNVAVVRNFLSRLLDPTPAATVVELPQGITLSHEPVADPRVYDLHLREGKEA